MYEAGHGMSKLFASFLKNDRNVGPKVPQQIQQGVSGLLLK